MTWVTLDAQTILLPVDCYILHSEFKGMQEENMDFSTSGHKSPPNSTYLWPMALLFNLTATVVKVLHLLIVLIAKDT